MQVDPKFVEVCCMMIGYMVQDFFLGKLQFNKGEYDEKMECQMDFHHAVTIFLIICCFAVGYTLLGIANLVVLMEFSTIFLNYRNIYPKE